MLARTFLLAQRRGNSEINQWLDKNPLVLGLIFLAIGLVLAYSGVREMKKGVAVDKYGNEVGGGMAKFISGVRIVGGAVAALFGLYKIVMG